MADYSRMDSGYRGALWIAFLTFEAWWAKAVEHATDDVPRVSREWKWNRPEERCKTHRFYFEGPLD